MALILINTDLKAKNSTSVVIRYSKLSIIGVLSGVISCFLPWVYRKVDIWHYPPGTLYTIHYHIFFVNNEDPFWGLPGINRVLVGPLVLIVIGLVISLIFSFEIKNNKKIKQIGFVVGLLLIILSMLYFLFIIIIVKYFIVFFLPHIGVVFAIFAIILIYLGNKSLKGENEKLIKTVISLPMIDELSSKKVSLSALKTIRISILSIIGVVFGIASYFLPWIYWSQNWADIFSGDPYAPHYHIYFVNRVPLAQFNGYLIGSLILLIIGLTISLIFSFEFKYYEKLTQFGLVGAVLIIMSIIAFPLDLYKGFDSGIYLPHFGVLFAILGGVLICFGYLSLKGKNKKLIKTVFSFSK